MKRKRIRSIKTELVASTNNVTRWAIEHSPCKGVVRLKNQFMDNNKFKFHATVISL